MGFVPDIQSSLHIRKEVLTFRYGTGSMDGGNSAWISGRFFPGG